MAIRSRTNLYPGVNPHLNSFLQDQDGTWPNFHNLYIADLTRLLNAVLPPGYYALSQQSLQIGTYDLLMDAPVSKPSFTVPAVAIYKRPGPSQETEAASTSITSTLTLPILLAFDELETITIIVVFQQEARGKLSGKPITRIEVLSPANKPIGSYFGSYSTKRLETVGSGLRLVEVDFLHERPPVIQHLASYPALDEGATPYHIAVSDPRPTLLKGLTSVYGFGVLDSIPVITIPLVGDDSVLLDFGHAYNQTFTDARPYHEDVVDYAQEPERFHTYTPNDQQRIRDHMAAIAANPPVDESTNP
jgi:hypothetical protein